jgi:DNA-binding transcriptional LysR family regulator
MMREFTRVKSHIAALQNIQAGTVDVCCFQTAIESFVAPVLHRFHVQYPSVAFNVRMSSTDEAMEALTSGTAEIGLVLNPPVRDTIASTQVFRDSMIAAFAPNHPLADRRSVSLRELARFPFTSPPSPPSQRTMPLQTSCPSFTKLNRRGPSRRIQTVMPAIRTPARRRR